eukprot:CAMPEP_0171326912 /NCGR_PEP_ID=MMETSP0816-20121228/117754_1 /TAXON_ID=420281 /ORGANISM="Proboscia inermis, Strain CCAP1064/1" /LENGTH=59 /DNA_ID=CAMNT_0011826505 /DNA_START=287 /DNA_END=466 /DNA_ORIENTATION=-
MDHALLGPKEVGDLGYCGSMRPGYVQQMTLGDFGHTREDCAVGGGIFPFERFGNGLLHA